jgi:phosphoglycolate phosphatase-like HAD superfamily hydrolase
MDLSGLDAIIFDFDGVLVESVDVKAQAFGALYTEHGEDVVRQVKNYHRAHGGISRFEKFRYFQTEILENDPLTDADIADLADAFSTLVVDRVVAAPMVNGAQSFLDYAGEKLMLFVVSGTPTAELNDVLQRREMRQLFSGVWGSPRSKAENISELLDIHELRADRCVMIGDALADYDGAAANDVPFLGRVAASDENLFVTGTTTFMDFSQLPESWRPAS